MDTMDTSHTSPPPTTNHTHTHTHTWHASHVAHGLERWGRVGRLAAPHHPQAESAATAGASGTAAAGGTAAAVGAAREARSALTLSLIHI